MADTKVVIDIAPDGSTNIDAIGFKGKGCKEATKEIERALGGGTSTNKPEYFKDSEGRVTQG